MTGPGPRLATDDPRAGVLRLLRPPAFFLLAVGIVSLLLSAAALVSAALGVSLPIAGPMGLERSAPPALDTLLLAAIVARTVCGALTTWGALSAMRLRGYAWSIIGAAAAMMPLSPTCAMGVPLGIWMLVVLVRPGVKRAFAA